MNICYKVSLCEYCQLQSCKAFNDLSIRAKMIRGERPLLRKNLAQTDQPSSKTPISINIRSSRLSRQLSSPSEKKFSYTRIESPLRAFQQA